MKRTLIIKYSQVVIGILLLSCSWAHTQTTRQSQRPNQFIGGYNNNQLSTHTSYSSTGVSTPNTIPLNVPNTLNFNFPQPVIPLSVNTTTNLGTSQSLNGNTLPNAPLTSNILPSLGLIPSLPLIDITTLSTQQLILYNQLLKNQIDKQNTTLLTYKSFPDPYQLLPNSDLTNLHLNTTPNLNSTLLLPLSNLQPFNNNLSTWLGNTTLNNLQTNNYTTSLQETSSTSRILSTPTSSPITTQTSNISLVSNTITPLLSQSTQTTTPHNLSVNSHMNDLLHQEKNFNTIEEKHEQINGFDEQEISNESDRCTYKTNSSGSSFPELNGVNHAPLLMDPEETLMRFEKMTSKNLNGTDKQPNKKKRNRRRGKRKRKRKQRTLKESSSKLHKEVCWSKPKNGIKNWVPQNSNKWKKNKDSNKRVYQNKKKTEKQNTSIEESDESENSSSEESDSELEEPIQLVNNKHSNPKILQTKHQNRIKTKNRKNKRSKNRKRSKQHKRNSSRSFKPTKISRKDQPKRRPKHDHKFLKSWNNVKKSPHLNNNQPKVTSTNNSFNPKRLHARKVRIIQDVLENKIVQEIAIKSDIDPDNLRKCRRKCDKEKEKGDKDKRTITLASGFNLRGQYKEAAFIAIDNLYTKYGMRGLHLLLSIKSELGFREEVSGLFFENIIKEIKRIESGKKN